MLKTFARQSTMWWTVVVIVFTKVESCTSCTSSKNNPKNKLPVSTPAAQSAKVSNKRKVQPVTLNRKAARSARARASNIDSGIDTSWGTSSDSDASVESNGNASSGSSSGNFSSGSSGTSSWFSPRHISTPPRTPTKFAGLTNIGNTCYLNAVLQVLAVFYEKNITKTESLKSLVKLINNEKKPLDAETMTKFLHSLPDQIKKTFELGQQHDPDELITSLNALDPFLSLIKSYERLTIKVNEQNTSESFWQKTRTASQEDYALRIPLTKKEKLDLSEMIAYDSEEMIKSDSGGIDFTQSEWEELTTTSAFLEQHKAVLTPVENNKSKQHIRQNVIRDIPAKLYVQLRRFSNAGSNISKNTDQVSGTLKISIKPDPCGNEQVDFDLRAFIVHLGNNTQSGHYIAYVKREGKWYEANDSSVKEITESGAEQESQDGYLFFYENNKEK